MSGLHLHFGVRIHPSVVLTTIDLKVIYTFISLDLDLRSESNHIIIIDLYTGKLNNQMKFEIVVYGKFT